ncbi:SphA family protein [Dyella sp.]|uniref:SphA family protein n=1 Tax=Dyella sp. TaxID=1869338 RepID=UPI002ED3ED3C
MSRNTIVSRALACIIGIGLTWAAASHASENLSPFLPGATTGVPAGALPPPGLYYDDTFYLTHGDQLKDGAGHGIPLKLRNYTNTSLFLWVPGWKLLGADYAANAIFFYDQHNVDTRAIGGYRSRSTGFFNPIITPAILSWNLGHGFFTSAGMSFYLPTGNYRYRDGKTLQTSYANDYWTVEPSWAVTWLHDGWNLTLNNVVDINKRNSRTDYLSGNAYYLDLTASRTIGHWTVGVIGNYSRQFSDDRQYGSVVGNGNRFEHMLVGPLLAYDFGRAKVSLRYLQDIRTRNDVAVSFAFASVSFRLF